MDDTEIKWRIALLLADEALIDKTVATVDNLARACIAEQLGIEFQNARRRLTDNMLDLSMCCSRNNNK